MFLTSMMQSCHGELKKNFLPGATEMMQTLVIADAYLHLS